MSFSETIFDKIYWLIPYRVKNIYYSIRDFFFPRQKWLTKKIGRGWCDKVELIEIVAFESIVHFIEEEEAFERIEWSATPEHAEAAREYKRAYNYVKIRIPILEDQNKSLWEDQELKDFFDNGLTAPIPNQDGVENKRHALNAPTGKAKETLDKIRENEKEIEWMTQEVVEIVAKYRSFMWT